MDDGPVPTVGTHKGVSLHDQQSPERLALVRAEIDLVLAMSDPNPLFDWAGDPRHSPESRLLAAAMVESMWQTAAETRALRPGIDLEKLRAATACLNSQKWRDPEKFCSLLDFRSDVAVRREELLGVGAGARGLRHP